MSKKSFLILLILPFILSLLFFMTSNFLFTTIQGDIANISWKYRNYEGFSLNEEKILLEATPVLANNQEDVDATLSWSVINTDSELEPHAYIEVENNDSYLVLVSPGEIKITCTNTSGNISKSFNARIYTDGTIIMNTRRVRSFNKIDKYDYYGEYDFINENEYKDAEFYLDVEVLPTSLMDSITVDTSSNITFDVGTGKVTINDAGDSYIKVKSSALMNVEATYEFKVVSDGYNVYSYNELLWCTNKAKLANEKGKIVCLQVEMDSLSNLANNEGSTLFGNYNEANQTFNFENEVILFESTYNTEYIKQYNEAMQGQDYIEDKIVAGIYISNDFYGNGYMINQHDLTYPISPVPGSTTLFEPGENQLFKGPLPFILIGNNTKPFVKAYGQDNVGFYVEGDDIKINDVYFKNCDFSSILQNNDYVGTVLEADGNNITISNSRLSSGRTVLRTFSSNVKVVNSLLEKGREFIAKVGSNEFEKINTSGNVTFNFDNEDGSVTSKTMSKEDFLTKKDETLGTDYFTTVSSKVLLDNYMGVDISEERFNEYVTLIDELLCDQGLIDISSSYKCEVEFIDTYFYQSGIFSLGIESIFNGPFLYNGAPIKGMFEDLLSGVVYPNNVGGISYPSNIKLSGDTRFYDYKAMDEMDSTCLVYQDLTFFTEGEEIDLDQFFPIKKVFKKEIEKLNYHHIDEEKGKTYYSTPIAYYGGGLNLSKLNIDDLTNKDVLSESVELNTFKETMSSSPAGSSINELFVYMMGRCVPMATGFRPFKTHTYNTNYLYGEQVSLDTLKSRA